MKAWILVLLGCCGCLEDALPASDLEPQDLGHTLCAKSDNQKKTVVWDERDLQVQCLKDYGGGWLLVARSGRTSSIDQFGWLMQDGSLDEPERAYSLGEDLKFTEILVVAGVSQRLTIQEFSEVVKIRVFSEDFISDYAIRSDRPLATTMLQGACNREDVVISAFAWLGQTSRNAGYWFGESDGITLSATGLYPDGWRFRGSSCDADGNFGEQSGAIYVRALKEQP